MMQYNFRTRLELNLFSGHFDKVGHRFDQQIYIVHTVHAREWRLGLIKKWYMLGVRLSSYGCTREVGRAQDKLLSDRTR